MNLITAPNKLLSTPVDHCDFESMDIVNVTGNMCKIMMQNNGIGLSANQVGINARMFVMRPLASKEVKKPFAVINPIIRDVSNNTVRAKEGCLSFPMLFLEVERPESVVAQFIDIDGKECIMEFNGIDARCFLHEYDHLEGIVYTDRVSQLKLKRAKTKQQKLLKRM